MNSQAILKKTLPLIITIVIVIAIAVSCTVFSKDKAVPMITNPTGAYLTVNESGREYSITNERVYEMLRNGYGLNVLKELMDIDLLKQEMKGSVSFWDSVTETEIDEAIEKAMFPNGRDNLDQDEIDEAIKKFEDTQYANGFRTEIARRNAQRLILARKAYALAQLEKEIIEKDAAATQDSEKFFPAATINAKYTALYNDGYWAVIVTFSTANEANQALEQLDIEIQRRDTTITNDFTKWVRKSDKAVLSQQEIVEAMIKLYNTQYSYRLPNFPTELLTLQEGVQYQVVGEKITFNTDLVKNAEGEVDKDSPLNALYFSNDDLRTFNAEILQQVKVRLISYNPDTSLVDKDQKWFTPEVQVLNNGNLNYFVLKVGVDQAPTQEEVLDDILEILKNDRLTATYINTQMTKLRDSKGLIIYDEGLESMYISEANSFNVKHEPTKKASKDVVAVLGDKEYTADAFFAALNARNGMAVALERINFEKLLSDPVLNTVFNYLGTGSQKDNILDDVAWQELNQRIVAEKAEFSASYYAAMGWQAYMEAAYGAKDEQELRMYFLYENINTKYKNVLKDLTGLDETSALWLRYLANMQKMVDDYYSVTGYHMLITIYDNAGNPTDPETWTDAQKALAKELDGQIKDYLVTFGDYRNNLQLIENEFKKAPKFLANLPQTVAGQPVLENGSYVLENIEVSRFKTAGLMVDYQDLGSFTNAQMVERFSDAVREIWQDDPESSQTVIYGLNQADKFIETEFGFHVYINTKSVDIARWEDSEGNKFVLPTLTQIQKYLVDTSDPTLTTAMKAAITRYYAPIADELAGQTNAAINFVQDQKALNIVFNHSDYTLEEYRTFLQVNIDSLVKQLVYRAHEAE
jgi:hypothetical protein